MNGLGKLALLALTILALASQAEARKSQTNKKARSAQPTPEVSFVYSWHRCGPCKVLLAYVDKKTDVLVDTLSIRPIGVLEFPKVVYTDGSSDTGQRIYNGTAKLPKKVLFIEWIGD